MAYDPAIGEMVLFGGDATDFLDDTWSYDGSTWTEKSPTTSPPAREAASMAYDPAIGKVVLFGGFGAGGPYGDTWTYQQLAAPPTATISSPAGGQAYVIGTPVPTSFSCAEGTGGPGIESCTDSNGVATGTGALDTSSAGEHTYTVTAVSEDGEEGRAQVIYTVTKATPAIATEASDPVALGGQVSDTATISGGHSPTGTLTFSAYGPGDTTCSAAPVYTSEAITVSGDGTYTSTPSFSPAEPGTYHWVASYSGDAGNEAVAGTCGDTGESVTVGKAPSATSIAATPDTAVLGGAVTISSRVTGHSPTGTVTFSDGTVVLGSASVGPAGVASITTSSLAAGGHDLSAAYSGDTDNLASSSPVIAVTITETPPSPSPPPPSPPAAPSAPSVRILYSPNSPHSPNPEGGPRYTFQFTDEVPGTTFYCKLDKAHFKPCHPPQVYRHLKKGRHHFAVKSVDGAGVASPVEKVTFYVGRRGGS
jgi:hypothetical protein